MELNDWVEVPPANIFTHPAVDCNPTGKSQREILLGLFVACWMPALSYLLPLMTEILRYSLFVLGFFPLVFQQVTKFSSGPVADPPGRPGHSGASLIARAPM